MPVRMGTPVGVKGITQLVAGPQFATGVGLVLYGASAIHQAKGRVSVVRREEAIELPPKSEKKARRAAGFLDWFKAAF